MNLAPTKQTIKPTHVLVNTLSVRGVVVIEALLRIFRSPFGITRGELAAAVFDEVDDVAIFRGERQLQQALIDGAKKSENGFVDAIGNEDFRGDKAVVLCGNATPTLDAIVLTRN